MDNMDIGYCLDTLVWYWIDLRYMFLVEGPYGVSNMNICVCMHCRQTAGSEHVLQPSVLSLSKCLNPFGFA
jgi:hypothetical protein